MKRFLAVTQEERPNSDLEICRLPSSSRILDATSNHVETSWNLESDISATLQIMKMHPAMWRIAELLENGDQWEAGQRTFLGSGSSSPAFSHSCPTDVVYSPVFSKRKHSGNTITHDIQDTTSSAAVSIGIDFITGQSLDCGMANGFAVMTEMHKVFEDSIDELLPLLHDVTDAVLREEASSLTSQITSFSIQQSIPRFGAVLRSGRGRVQYYIHCYDLSVPVLKVFETLIMDPRLASLQTVSRIYPVTFSSHPDIDFESLCLKQLDLALAVQLQQPKSYRSTVFRKTLNAPKVGLAIESHHAHEFGAKLASRINQSFPHVEFLERKPLNCALMVSVCFFNDIFLCSVWAPINTNNLNNYRINEMSYWVSHFNKRIPPSSSTVFTQMSHNSKTVENSPNLFGSTRSNRTSSCGK